MAANFSGANLQKLRVDPNRSVNFDWLGKAAMLPGRTLHLGLAIWHLASLRKSPYLQLQPRQLARFGVSRDTGYVGLERLRAAGLIAVSRRKGRIPRLTLIDDHVRPLKIV